LVGEMPTLAIGVGLGKWSPDRLAPDSQKGKGEESRIVNAPGRSDAVGRQGWMKPPGGLR
jgi:hypothetical protein